jgi:uncharacterized zinc-type alcohol dehydrogenase-like protein
MIEVSGYAAMQAKASLIPYAFERRAPVNKDVVIEIQYCGICHTDIHQVNNEWGGSSNYPIMPGHEITGKVTGVGPKVTRYKLGDRVGVGCFVDYFSIIARQVKIELALAVLSTILVSLLDR